MAGFALAVIAAAFLGAAVLLDIRVRLHLSSLGLPWDHSAGLLPWIASAAVLIAGSSFAGLAWQRASGPVRSVFPVLLAGLAPVLAVLGAALFFYPISWPAWIDSELVGSAAILSGGIASVLLAPTLPANGRSSWRLVARALLCLWGALIAFAATGAVLFLE